MNLRDQIADADDLYTETLEVPEWGVTLTLRTPTLAERAQMLRRFVKEDGTPANTDVSEMYPAVIIAACVDPETGGPLFTARDADLLRSKNGATIERVATAALRMCGLGDDAIPTGSAASSSTASASTSID